MLSKTLRAVATIALGAIIAAPMPASALEISRHAADSETVNAIQLSGSIDDGDVLSLQAYISKLPEKPNITVYLDSTGGRMQEAMALGRFFHSAKIRTAISANPAKCLSACALAFLGGRDAETGKPHRVKSSTASLGYHAFRTNFEDKAYEAQNLNAAVAHAQKVILQISQYLTDIGENLEFLRLSLEFDNKRMNLLRNDQALGLGIFVLDEKSGQIIDPTMIARRVKG